MNIQFLSTIAVVAPEPARSRELFVDALGLPLKADGGGDYFHSEEIAGIGHFGIWPLGEAAQSCFGTDEWPADRPVPQASIEFDLESAAAVAEAARELEDKGFQLVHGPREEPWGQTVARVLSSEGLIVGISYVPSLHAD